jgi:predicted DNA-binding protein (UPF0251 family)
MFELTENVVEVDELESLRLADVEGLSHEKAAEQMQISRATFGRILERARYKTAEAIIKGKAIKIESYTEKKGDKNENSDSNG